MKKIEIKNCVRPAAATLLTLAALLHATRLAMGWDLTVSSYMVPAWISGLAVLIAGYLAYELWMMK